MLSFIPALPGAKASKRAVAAKTASAGAGNTPVPAAHQKDVRLGLAARLVALFPGLSHEKYAELYAFAVQMLGNMALEEILKLRKALFGTLKDYACLPPEVSKSLTREAEQLVSEPVLRFCAGLSDTDLKALLKNHAALGRTKTRENGRLGYEPVLSADTDLSPGSLATENQGNGSWLRLIVEQARSVTQTRRASPKIKIPPSIAGKLESFIDRTVEDILMDKEELDYRTSADITRVFRRRMDYAAARQEWESVLDYLKDLLESDKFEEEAIADALAMQDYAFVWAALAYKAGTTMQNVQKIFGMKMARPIVALCWQAGISMRLAFQLQKDAGFVPPKDLIYPREGSDYPLSSENLSWQLEFLGLKVA